MNSFSECSISGGKIFSLDTKFINVVLQVHLAPGTKFDIQKYIKRSLEDDFKMVVGIRYDYKISIMKISYASFELIRLKQTNFSPLLSDQILLSCSYHCMKLQLLLSSSSSSSSSVSSRLQTYAFTRNLHFSPNNDATNSKPKTNRAKSIARLINSNPWSTHLESSLSPLLSPPSKTTILQVLPFINNPSKALAFFNWAHKIPGFPHSHQPYFLMLEILGRNRNLNPARNFLFSIEKRSNGAVKLEDRFFNSLIRSYGRAGLFLESIKLFSLMKSMGVSPSGITFNSLILILVKRGRFGMAENLFDEMLKTYGVTPDAYTFNILIRGFCKNSMVDRGFQVFREMARFDCDPDVVTYNTLVDGLCREGKVKIARNVVNGMIRKSRVGLDLEPNVVTYTSLVRGYCMKGEIDEALVVFEEMVNRGIKPNGVTYNTLLKGLCEGNKVDKIKEILERAAEGAGSFVPDACTFNTLIDAHCNAGNLDEALKMFKKMEELKVSPDSATYSVLIRALCQKGNFERAEQLFDELSEKEIVVHDDGCTPLVAAYRTMFEFLCENGKTNKAEKVFRQLMKRGTQDPPCYKILIMGHCREGTYQAGYELLVLMLRRDFMPDFEIYKSLVDGLLHKGEPLLASQTLEKMLKSSHLPKTCTFHSVLAGLLEKGCAHESASFVVLMLEKKVVQNLNLSTKMVRLLFTHGQQDKAFNIVGLLFDHGFLVNMEELIGFLVQSSKLLEAQKMLRFCLEKSQNVDIEICNIVIEGLCKMRRLSEAFGLFYELVERGRHQQLSCLEQLRIALEVGGRSEEAQFISKRMLYQLQLDPSTESISRMRRSVKVSC